MIRQKGQLLRCSEELKAFYKTMDNDGDGIDVEELLQFIRKTRSTFQKGKPQPWQRMAVVMQRMAGLAKVLEDELGLRLAVPQSAMAACYPPRASYKMHLDSYYLHGCKDDIPRKVTVLLYCILIALCCHSAAGDPVKEIWHEVLESHGDRYALTVWIHDRERAPLAG
eukprot:Skav205747  [mRNA]  locus=scaffold3116:51558:57415:- [translate_table: standard]